MRRHFGAVFPRFCVRWHLPSERENGPRCHVAVHLALAFLRRGNCGNRECWPFPVFPLPGFFLHPADCPSLRTGKGRKRGFDKPSHPSPFIRLDDTGGKKETSSFTTIEGTCHVSHPHAFIGPGLQALHGRALHRRDPREVRHRTGSIKLASNEKPSRNLSAGPAYAGNACRTGIPLSAGRKTPAL